MGRSGIRFRPPEDPVSPEMRWLLLRAFGPVGIPFDEEFNPGEAVRLARLFEISPRIAVRQGSSRLIEELEESWASHLLEDRQRTVYAALQRLAAVRDIRRVAKGLANPLVFLKFAALQLSGVVEPGSREVADIDVLVPTKSLGNYCNALSTSGYIPRGGSRSEHHLPILDHPTHGPVEIHRFIPGIKVGHPGESATAESLEADGLLVPLAELPDFCRIPNFEVQMAHILAHGIAQHGSHPDAYSPARLLADLIDLGEAVEDRNKLFERAQTRIGHVVSREETMAVRDLCDQLRRGDRPWSESLSSQSAAGVFLRHVLFGLLNTQYRQAMNLSLFGNVGLSDRIAVVATAVLLKQTFFPSRGQIDKIYGAPKNWLGYLGWRMFRPFSLLARLVRYCGSALKLRLGGRL